MHFETECVMALQGHPRSLILAPIGSVFDFLLVINSNLGPILPPFRDNAVFLMKAAPYPIPPEFWGVLLGLDCRCWVSEERRPYAFCARQHIYAVSAHMLA